MNYLSDYRRMVMGRKLPSLTESEDWSVSKLTFPEDERVSGQRHREAMEKAGWVSAMTRPDAFKVGDKVLVSLDNGWESWATIVKFFKNGAARVDRDGTKENRASSTLWKRT